MVNRADLIVKYFEFLVSNYGFQINRKEFAPQDMGNAIVIYKSSNFGIEIVIDRNQVLISIGEVVDSRNQWFDLTDIVNYYTHEEKDLYSFPEKSASTSWDKVIENQLEILEKMLKQYCEPLLLGKPWRKEEIIRLKQKRVAVMLKKFNQKPA